MTNIRLVEEKDIAAIVLVLQNTASDWNEKILRDCFSESYRHYVFLHNEKIIGFLCIKNNIDFVELLQICVDPDYQRQKIATQLLEFVLNETEIPMHLEVRVSNHKAMALYEKMGFVKEGLRKKYYRDFEDAVLYTHHG